MGLRDYQARRDFTKTSEPKGKVGKEIKEPIFVVQEHWAAHHHFDFRLEIDGGLKSWAVPKGVPEKAGEKRLAVQTEDHPLEYAFFEGIIPEGQYGAGKVRIWDRGELEIQEKTINSIKFALSGQKLTGPFTLFHPPSFKKDNWLLMKKS